jgi:hypothetical protein
VISGVARQYIGVLTERSYVMVDRIYLGLGKHSGVSGALYDCAGHMHRLFGFMGQNLHSMLTACS